MNLNILVTEPIDPCGIEYLRGRGYQIKMGTGIAESTLLKEIQGCHGLLTRNGVITEKIMRANPDLKVISMHGVGVDNIDVEAATRLGIQVTNAAGSNKLSVAEYTIGLIIALARNIPFYDRELRGGNWDARNALGMDLAGKTLGIIGLGSIGSIVAQKASLGLSMQVIAYQRHASKAAVPGIQTTQDLAEVLRAADFLTLHIPATSQTKNMIGPRELSMMKPGAYLINTARGEVVDQDALAQALKEGRLRGAAIDVFPGGIPEKDNPLFSFKNVIVSPHTAAFTKESTARMALYAAKGIDEVLSGKTPTHPVNFPGGSGNGLLTCAS